MALFTDGLMCDAEALREYESSVLTTAATEDIGIEAKLRVAQREIELELVTFLLRYGSMFRDAQCGLSRVVVTDALRHWHAVKGLECLYRDAYHHHLNDRFGEKAERFATLSRAARQVCFDSGVGVVLRPIPRASKPEITTAPGGSEPARTLLISIAWHRGLDCGAAGEARAVEVPAGHVMFVRPTNAPAGVDRWSVYAGPTTETMVRQDAEPLRLPEEWTESGALATTGERPPTGQTADMYVRANNILNRG